MLSIFNGTRDRGAWAHLRRCGARGCGISEGGSYVLLFCPPLPPMLQAPGWVTDPSLAKCPLWGSQAEETFLVFEGCKCKACIDSKSWRTREVPGRRAFSHRMTEVHSFLPVQLKLGNVCYCSVLEKLNQLLGYRQAMSIAQSLPGWTWLFHSMTLMRWKHCAWCYMLISLSRDWSIPGAPPGMWGPIVYSTMRSNVEVTGRTIPMEVSAYGGILKISFPLTKMCKNKNSLDYF